MASLLRSIFGGGGTRQITTVDDYISTLGELEFYYQGNSYNLGSGLTGTYGTQRLEEPPVDLQGYAQSAYAANGVVFACLAVRMSVFSQARFQWQRFNKGRPSEMFSTPGLVVLEQPWPGGTTQDLLLRVIQDADLAGNSYWVRAGAELVRLRPDWVRIVMEPRVLNGGHVGWRRYGYLYWEGGKGVGSDPVPFLPDEVMHYAPNPDPLAPFRGMSWLTPVLREVVNDKGMGLHKSKFLENAATPNLSVALDKDVTREAFSAFVEKMNLTHRGAENAYKTLYLGGGADVKVIGADFKQMDFATVQGHGETRIAAAAGVPPVIVGLSEGLAAATYCGVYDNPVWTTRGIVKLGEVSPGDEVWSYVDGRLVSRKVIWHAQTGTKPVYVVRTKNRAIRFTDNHPILVRVPGSSRGGNVERSARVEWRRVDQLCVGDQVVQAQRLPDQCLDRLPTGLPATTDALQWLGAYTGDGCLSGTRGVRMCIPSADRVRTHYADLAVRLFTKQTTWSRPGRKAQDGLTVEMVRLREQGLTYRQIVNRMGLVLHPMSVRDRVNIATRDYSVAPTAPVVVSEIRNAFRFHSMGAVQWHHDMGVTGTAKTKRVPGWVFELREEFRLAYLAGVVDTDGSVGKDGRLVIHFANRDLVEDVRMLLISCGIQCSNIAEYSYKASVLPNPGSHDAYHAWRFTVSSAVEVARIPFADSLYRQRVEANRHRHRQGGGDAARVGLGGDLGFYTVRSIELEPEEPVYDIEVEEGHSFLVDGVVVHNSNYSQARRRFADGTMHTLWQNVAGCLAPLVPRPQDLGNAIRLWFDTRDVPFLREDRKDAAEIQGRQAATIASLIMQGFEPESAVKAVDAEDWGLLVHTGLVSVQLQPPGTTIDSKSDTPSPNGKPKAIEPANA